MLSYQLYHAGNRGVKTLDAAVCILPTKETPFDYIDTHAGAGFISSLQAWLAKAESKGGILVTDWNQQKTMTSMTDYHSQIIVDLQNQQYPGSPMPVKRLLR